MNNIYILEFNNKAERDVQVMLQESEKKDEEKDQSYMVFNIYTIISFTSGEMPYRFNIYNLGKKSTKHDRNQTYF